MLETRCTGCECRVCICTATGRSDARDANFACVCGARFTRLTHDELDDVIDVHAECEPDDDYYEQIGVK